MSTRSVILIDSEFDEYDWEKKVNVVEVHPIARMYRHCDGYPDGAGAQVCASLAEASLCRDVNNRNWAQHFLKVFLAADMDVEFEPCAGDGTWSHGDLEYVYRVTGKSDYTGGKEDAPDAMGAVAVEVFDVCWGDNPDKGYSNLGDGCGKLLFKGNWKEMAAFIRRYSEKNNTGGRCVFDAGYDPNSWMCRNVSEETWNGVRVMSNTTEA